MLSVNGFSLIEDALEFAGVVGSGGIPATNVFDKLQVVVEEVGTRAPLAPTGNTRRLFASDNGLYLAEADVTAQVVRVYGGENFANLLYTAQILNDVSSSCTVRYVVVLNNGGLLIHDGYYNFLIQYSNTGAYVRHATQATGNYHGCYAPSADMTKLYYLESNRVRVVDLATNTATTIRTSTTDNASAGNYKGIYLDEAAGLLFVSNSLSQITVIRLSDYALVKHIINTPFYTESPMAGLYYDSASDKVMIAGSRTVGSNLEVHCSIFKYSTGLLVGDSFLFSPNNNNGTYKVDKKKKAIAFIGTQCKWVTFFTFNGDIFLSNEVSDRDEYYFGIDSKGNYWVRTNANYSGKKITFKA